MSSRPTARPRRLAACVALLAALAIIPAANAQQTFAPSPGPALAPPHAFPAAPDFLPSVPVQPVPGCDDASRHEYWIASSRDCPQLSWTAGHALCPLSFFRCDPAGRPCPEPHQAFFQSLQPGVPICVIVHGSFTEGDTACVDARRTSEWLRAAQPGVPVQFVYYSWPSDPLVPLFPCVDLGVLGRRASYNGMYLAQLVAQFPPETPVTLIGHSHGTRAIAACLHVMGGGAIEGGQRYPAAAADPRRMRAVFAAAALDHHWLVPGERFGCALPRVEVLVNLRNREDGALALYPLRRPFSHRALGRSGLTSKDHRLLGGLGPKVIEFDVTANLGPGHIWPRYYRRPEIAQAIAPYALYVDAIEPGAAGGQVTAPTFAPSAEFRPPQRQHESGRAAQQFSPARQHRRRPIYTTNAGPW